MKFNVTTFLSVPFSPLYPHEDKGFEISLKY